jgi:D-psicose/D-tagatose/L-ribulose 3-epimerase
LIAACEWIFGGRSGADVIAFLADAGCDGVELGGDPARTDRAELAGLLEAAGVKATGITALCRWPTQDRDLAHPDAGARRRAVEYYRGCVELAVAVNAPVVGLIPVAVGRVAALGDPAQEWELAVAGAREVARYAAAHDVQVGIEAINRYESFLLPTAERALAFADDIDEPNVGVVLDLFHMNLEEADPAAAVAAAADRLVALHVADSNRRGPGRGHADIAGPVRAAVAAGYTGPLVLECTAPGPDPFNADKGEAAMRILDEDIRRAIEPLRALREVRGHAS